MAYTQKPYTHKKTPHSGVLRNHILPLIRAEAAKKLTATHQMANGTLWFDEPIVLSDKTIIDRYCYTQIYKQNVNYSTSWFYILGNELMEMLKAIKENRVHAKTKDGIKIKAKVQRDN